MVAKVNKKLSTRPVLKEDLEQYINRELAPIVEKLRLWTDAMSDAVMDGEGDPNGVVTASPGALYRNTLGGAGATLWVKESGTDSFGWVAK